MASAKDLIIKPISRQDADRIVKQIHYSGKTVKNAQLHFGVFLDGKCGGALQFGPSLDKRKGIGIVADTKWNDFIELNRMALADWLPKNSESRAISIWLLKKHYPNIELVGSQICPLAMWRWHKPAKTIPLKDGYFDRRLPKEFFEGNPKSITVNWIDFYRN